MALFLAALAITLQDLCGEGKVKACDSCWGVGAQLASEPESQRPSKNKRRGPITFSIQAVLGITQLRRMCPNVNSRRLHGEYFLVVEF